MSTRAISTILLFIFIWLTNPVTASGTLEKYHKQASINTFELKGIND
jgi:multisubunit Na+/H+ antiporter MnhG subunit